jgi:hypothetical protein
MNEETSGCTFAPKINKPVKRVTKAAAPPKEMSVSAQKSVDRMRNARSEAELKTRMLDPRRAIPLRYPSSNKLLLIAELELDQGTFSIPIYSNTNLDIVAQKFANEHGLE